MLRVNIQMLRQDEVWVEKMKNLLKKDSVRILENGKSVQDTQLIVTDFPIEDAGKGIFLEIPFLIVSRECREEKILEAFAMGAEDYMVYPVSPEIARVRILRILRDFYKDGEALKNLPSDIHFTPNEYRLLSYMMANPGRVLSRAELLEGAFPELYEGYDRNVDNYIKQIRRKLEKVTGGKTPIETVYGAGYRYISKNNCR